MKSLVEHVLESEASHPAMHTEKNSKLALITKYLDKYEVEGGEHIGHGMLARTSYLVKCTSPNDVEDICRGIWSVIAEWQGRDKPEESMIKYMTSMWKNAFLAQNDGHQKKASFVRIPFEIYDNDARSIK